MINKINFTQSDAKWEKVNYTKKPKSNTFKNETSPSTSPNLKHISGNSSTINLNTNNQSFEYENTSPQSPLSTNTKVLMITDNNSFVSYNCKWLTASGSSN